MRRCRGVRGCFFGSLGNGNGKEKRKKRYEEGGDVIPSVISAVKACTVLKDVETGMAIHSSATDPRCNFSSSVRVISSLIHMYTKCGSLEDARRLFDSIQSVRDVISWTSIITGYADKGQFDVALKLFSTMQHEGCAPNERTFTAVIKACSGLAEREQGREIDGKISKVETLAKGRALHFQATGNGFEGDVFVASSLIEMYAKCGSLVDAKAGFDRIASPDVVAWTVLILGYVENKEEELALELMLWMKEKSFCAPNARTFTVAVKACANLAAKEDAKNVDGKMVKLGSLAKGMAVHRDAVKAGWSSEMFVASSLIDMYVKCGSLFDARMVFDKMISSNVVSWNSLLLGYVENDEEDLAMALLQSMRSFCHLDSRTLAAAAKGCSNLAAQEVAKEVDGELVKVKSLEKGREIHALAANCEKDAFLGCALVEMYSQCGSLFEAQRAYEEMSCRDLASWTALILAHADNGKENQALEVFKYMKPEGCVPDSGVFIAALKASSGLAGKGKDPGEKLRLKRRALEQAMIIHAQALRDATDTSIFFENTLVDTYAKCGSLEDARRAFDRMRFHSVVSWTVLITGCVENRNEELALELFSVMPVEPDTLSFLAALNSCIVLAAGEPGQMFDGRKFVKLRALERGMTFHSQAAAQRLETNFFLSNTLVELYASCGSMLDARRVFDRMPFHDPVSWNTLLLGYAQNGNEELALRLYTELERDDGELCSTEVRAQTFVAVLKACSSLADMEAGRSIHTQICRHGIETDEVLVASLVDLYGKCGSSIHSQLVFDSSPGEDLVSWNALLASYARQGDSHRVLGLFSRIRDESREVDAATFVSVLTACSHVGLVDRGRRYFQDMETEYGVGQGLDHYHCMIDLLGRANRLEEAVVMARTMPFEASSVTWRTVLAACGKWKNWIVGRQAFEALVDLGDEGDVEAACLLMVKAQGIRT